MRIKDVRFENPLLRSPITLLIDDLTPCVNPLYYFAEQVPRDAVDYHYREKDGQWYDTVDQNFRFPIAKEIDPRFIHEFASWVTSARVKGKISVIPYPAALGRVDRGIKGFPKSQVREFTEVVRKQIMRKFDVSSELITHTNALELKTGKLMNSISEHDWSQKQDAETLADYIAFSFEILKKAGIDPTGVTSPCNFGELVEGEYVRAILEASKSVLGSVVVWYFLHVDTKSLNVSPRVMYQDTERGEAVVSLTASVFEPFWSSQLTDEKKVSWIEGALEPFISEEGDSGRVVDLVSSGSHVTIVTHWQALYSNGSRYGLEALDKFVRRINSRLGDKVLWMTCVDITNYAACCSSALIRVLDKGSDLEITTSFPCKNLTLSADATTKVTTVIANGKKLARAESAKELKGNSWTVKRDGRVVVCLSRFKRKPHAKGYLSNISFG